MNKDTGFYIGNMKADAALDPKGWVVGSFYKDPVRKTEAVEVKYWEFKKGITHHETKISSTVEFTVLLKGKMTGMIDSQKVTMTAGEYVVIKPGTINNVPQEALKNIMGITVKAPSDVTAKKVVTTSGL